MHALAAATGWPVFCARRAGEAGLREEDGGGFPLWSFRAAPRPEAGFRASFEVPGLDEALGRALSASGADIVHFHHLAHLDLGLPAFARGRGQAVVWTLHDYHLLCARGQLVNRALERCPGPALERCAACVSEHLAAPAPLRRLAPRVPAALARPGRAALRLWGRLRPAPGPLADRLDRARGALSAAHRVLSPSRDLAERVRALGWAREVHVQDLPLLSPISVTPPGVGPLRLLFVGSLIPTKGPDVLLRAFGALIRHLQAAGVPEPELPTLSLYGPSPDFDGAPGYARDLIAAVGRTPRARYGGVFGDEGRSEVLGAADVLVLPSIWEENSPLVVREGVAAGLRVVASAVGGIAEIDPNARLVAPKDPNALLAALLAENALGRARRAPRGYSMELHIDALRAHFEDALRARGRA